MLRTNARWLLPAALVCACLVSACSVNSPARPPEADPSRTYIPDVSGAPVIARPLVVPPTSGLYLASYPDFGENEDDVTTERLQDFEKLSGRHIAWAYFSDNWGTSGIRFPADAVETIRDYGAVPFIRLMPRTDLDGPPEQTYTLARIAAGDFDSRLKQWAIDARDSKTPLMLEFGTEVNGDWFPWGGQWNGGPSGPALFQRAYRHIVDIFRAQGADNITWVFHVDAVASPSASWNTMAAYYPGDSYVDWIGLSAYGAQRPDDPWVSFEQVFAPAYRELAAVAPGKPMAVLEFGVTDGVRGHDKATWISDAFRAALSGRYPALKALSYWNETFEDDDGVISKLRIDSSSQALNAYRTAASSSSLVDRVRVTAR